MLFVVSIQAILVVIKGRHQLKVKIGQGVLVLDFNAPPQPLVVFKCRFEQVNLPGLLVRKGDFCRLSFWLEFFIKEVIENWDRWIFPLDLPLPGQD
jgi:hypothetical protein